MFAAMEIRGGCRARQRRSITSTPGPTSTDSSFSIDESLTELWSGKLHSPLLMIWTTRHLLPRHQCSTARASSRHQRSGDGEEFFFGSGKRSTELHLLRRDPPEISAFSFVCVRDKRRRHQDRGSSTVDHQRRRNFPS
ncbi:hypothetical protein M6B38_233710 [Iris pallida]|uniref:Uncharacterized protein n=1 Tax=Iris pallida TaxID=29817 RepID=A0AAX6DQH8_IRIPA|nr:hypothetical protein M6B38_233710 [Iris pallida]